MGFIMQIRPEVLKKIREDFPEGATVEVVEFHDQYRDVPAGTRGHVLCVDDTGTVQGHGSRTDRRGHVRG